MNTRGHRFSIWRAVVAVLAAIGLVFVLVTFTPLVSWWARDLAGPLSDPKGDVLIVLAGSSASDGVMGYNSYLRCQYALRAYQDGGFREIVLSGGGQPPIAVAMRDFLVGNGVSPDRLLLEATSTSTHENAIYTRRVLGSESARVVLLTSDYHMFRARR